jgi:uncharacterized coiled-coil protein SlyX
MTRSKALVAADARIAALEARLAVAAQVFRDQRATIRDLQAKLATRGVIAPITTRFVKADGSLWEKTRVGNHATSHQINQ